MANEIRFGFEGITKVGDTLWMAVQREWKDDPKNHVKLVAYNTETKQFMGTGGGTYTARDKEYTENIEFFSRDSSRVGASLSFEFDVENGEWHHKGLSSKGDPIHEIWTLREDLEKE